MPQKKKLLVETQFTRLVIIQICHQFLIIVDLLKRLFTSTIVIFIHHNNCDEIIFCIGGSQTESEHEAILDGPELDVDAPNAEPEPVAESKISLELAYEAA